jgi:spermidine/putrescine transport system permease protein
LTTFRRIIFPLITPAILSAFLIAFVVSIDEYAIASFLAANSETYPVYLFGQIRQAEHLPPMIPVATVMLLVSFCIVILAEIVRRRGDRRVGLSS